MLFFQQVNPQIFSFIPVAVFTFPIWSIGNNGQEPCRPLSPWPSWLLRSWTWQCRAEQYPKHPETSRGGICIIHLHITQRKVQISRKKSKIGLVYQLNLIMVSLHKHRSYLKPTFLEPQTTSFSVDVWWCPTIFQVKLWNHPIETTISKNRCLGPRVPRLNFPSDVFQVRDQKRPRCAGLNSWRAWPFSGRWEYTWRSWKNDAETWQLVVSKGVEVYPKKRN